MVRIGILSDTHGFINPRLFEFFKDCDQIWHAGDWGTVEILDILEKFKPLNAVYGNIDGKEIRIRLPEILFFEAEKVKVCLLHIGGYPGNYAPGFKKLLKTHEIDLMVCGHSHILKVMRDPINKFMHINPGACGNSGFQKVNTAIRLKIEGKKLYDLEVWEQKRE